ncbi:MAG: c-type cytochrome [Gemmatimonadaceae bacterium]
MRTRRTVRVVLRHAATVAFAAGIAGAFACARGGSDVAVKNDSASSATAQASTPPKAAAELPSPRPVAKVAFRVPDEAEIRDTVILASVRRGRAIALHTADSLPKHVGNRLVCSNCHQQAGTLKDGMGWVGVYARFPQYRSRAGATQLIEDRINDCFKRSLNGRSLVPESRDMRDMVAYMAFLSTGYPVGAEMEGQGLPRLEPLKPDTASGAKLFASTCTVCHGADGQGTDKAPPVWGAHSYNVGAGMSRLRTAASFIKRWMPQSAPGSLSAQQAYDVAAFVNSHSRPDFAGKERDWPHGDPPPDVAYHTSAAKNASVKK